MKKIVTKIKTMFKELAKKILKNEINAQCDDVCRVNHAVIGAHEELLKVLNNKKATKVMMTEAMEKAIANLNDAHRSYYER